MRCTMSLANRRARVASIGTRGRDPNLKKICLALILVYYCALCNKMIAGVPSELSDLRM
jgi:hypothetical protein